MKLSNHQKRLWQSMINVISQYLKRSSSDFDNLVGELEGALDASGLKNAELVTKWYEYWGPLEEFRASAACEGRKVAYEDVKEYLDAMIEFLRSIRREWEALMATVTFAVMPGKASRGIQLLYLKDEYSFYCENGPSSRGVSILVNEVELFFDDDGQILYVDGYCPYQGWLQTPLDVPAYTSAGLILISPEPESVPSGTAVGLNDLSSRWQVYVNAEGWVCIGDPANHGDQAVEFASNCVAVLKGDFLVALWLKPIIRESLGD